MNTRRLNNHTSKLLIITWLRLTEANSKAYYICDETHNADIAHPLEVVLQTQQQAIVITVGGSLTFSNVQVIGVQMTVQALRHFCLTYHDNGFIAALGHNMQVIPLVLKLAIWEWVLELLLIYGGMGEV